MSNLEAIDPQLSALRVDAKAVEQSEWVNRHALSVPRETRSSTKRKHEEQESEKNRAGEKKTRVVASRKVQKDSTNHASIPTVNKKGTRLGRPQSQILQHSHGESTTAPLGEDVYDFPADDVNVQREPASKSGRNKPEGPGRKRGRASKYIDKSQEIHSNIVEDVPGNSSASSPKALPTGSLQSQDQEAEDEGEGEEEEGGGGEEAATGTETDANSPSKNLSSRSAVLGSSLQWTAILNSVQANCTEESFIQSASNEQSEVKEVKQLCRSTRKAIRSYADIMDDAIDTERRIEAEEDLSSRLLAIDTQLSQVKKLNYSDRSKRKDYSKAKKTIRELYLWAIPGLVYLLKHSMNARSRRHYKDFDSTGLSEVCGILNLTVNLCQAAFDWHAKPESTRPITKAIRSKAFPGLKAFKKTFDRELSHLKIEDKRRENREKRRPERDELTDDGQSTPTEQPFSLSAMEEEIKKNLQHQLRKFLGPSPFTSQAKGMTPTPVTRQSTLPEPLTKWTREEQRELISQLQNPDSRDRLPKERYLKILNCPLLQNKLPEHIRDEALSLKPYLVKYCPQRDYLDSITYVDFNA